MAKLKGCNKAVESNDDVWEHWTLLSQLFLTGAHLLFFLVTFCYNQLFPVLINTAGIRGLRSHCQVLRVPPDLTTPVQHPGTAPIPVQNPISIFQSHELLPQQGQSPAAPILSPGRCPFLARGGKSPAASFCSAGQVTGLGSHTVSLRRQLSFTAPWHSCGNEESHNP